ncbi:MAG TPA: hypothetical protein ENM97_06805 [Moorella mulderi]|nr:hypothetical protein [Moorella mulderi]
MGLSLEERLKVYQVYRRAAEGLRERLAQGALIFSRPPETGICRDREEMPRQIAPEKLLEFYLKALSRKKQSSEIKPPMVLPPPISLESKIRIIFRILRHRVRITFKEILGRILSRREVIASFMALLELAKRGRVVLRQEKSFGDIEVEKVVGG